MRQRLLILSFSVTGLFAQLHTSTIGGRVTDPADLPIPNVSVTVTEELTASHMTTITGDSGDFVVPFLNPGSYRVRFVANGFKEQVVSGVHLEIGQQWRLNQRLELGQRSEAVRVTETPVQVNYVSPEIGQIIDSNQLLSLPELATDTRGRSPFLLAKLLPGVTAKTNNYGNVNDFSLAGGRVLTNEILVDGLPTTNPSDETYTFTPSPEAVQEFKVLTTPFSAEYGHTGGGVIIATSRAGTNQFHGMAYDLFRNRILNTRDFFAPTQSATKYVQNDPGGNLGGPVNLPQLYNGKDKTFFFVDFNVTLASKGNIYSGLVPTGPEKSGDFSKTVAGGQLVPIFDPGNERAPFPGNLIPSNRIDPVAAQIVKFYPAANASLNGQNYIVTPPNQNDNWQHLGRLDHNFSSGDRAFFRFGQYTPNANATVRIPNKANSDYASGWTDTQSVLSETHVFSLTLVSDFHVGWVQEDNYVSANDVAAPELGLKGVDLSSFPIINVAQMIPLGAKASNHDRDRSWVFSGALTWLHGRHTVKAGGDFRHQMYDNYVPGKLSGSYSFSNVFTAQVPNDTRTGFSVADLLLGLPVITQVNINDYTYRENINSAGTYIQDDFKVLPRLTVNLGLRWEFDGPYSEANNQFASFNPNLVNHLTGNLGDVQFAGRNGVPTHFSPNVYHDFLPRMGFAWGVLTNTVLRGGYGIYRLPSIGLSNVGLVSQYSVTTSFTSSDNNSTAPYILSSGVPQYSYNVDSQGLPSTPASLSRPTSSVTEIESRVRTPYNQTWQIGLQRQFSGNWILEADYVGTKGTKLPVALPLDQLHFNQWGGPQSLRPFPQYVSVTHLANDGNSFYNSLQSSLQRRGANGVLSFAYTWSKITDDVDGPAGASPIQDVYNLRNEHGIASYDVPHRFVASYVYRMPLGRGSRVLNGIPVVKDMVCGWEFSGVTEFQVGLPLTVTQNNNTQGFTATQRPTQTASAALNGGDRTLTRWFNTSAFTVTPALQAGNEPRFSFYGPGINNWDTSLMRNFPIGERLRVQLRGEFFNTLNHANFKNPNTALGNVNYGRITSDISPRVMELALRVFF